MKATFRSLDKITICTVFAVFLFVFPLTLHAKSIGRDQINIRSEPSTTSSVLYKAPLGYPIVVEKESKDWIYFRDWENNKGWVHKPLVSNIKTVVILVDKANVRDSGSEKGKVVAKAEQGEIYKVLEKKNNWVRLGYYHGDTPLGWIRSDLVFGGK